MPSALETLVKILKLEREQGYKNTAVIGGLAAFCENWRPQAETQARRPQHQLLVEELAELLKSYDEIDSKTERHKQITYMLDRITGRVPLPPEYAARLPAQEEQQEKRDSPPPPRPQERPEKPRDKQEQRRPEREERPERREGRRPDEGDRRAGRSRGRTATAGELDLKPLPTLARPPRRPRPEREPEQELAALRSLRQPVTEIKGIGPRMAESLAKLGIRTVEDMLFYLPRRYDDYTRLRYIRQLEVGRVATVIGRVARCEVRVGKGMRKDFTLVLEDGSGELQVTFFGQHYLSKQIRTGHQLVLSGRVDIWRDHFSMSSPEWEFLDVENLHTTGIVPVYAMASGLKPRSFRSQMKHVVDTWAGQFPDFIPQATLDRTELADLGWAVQQVHFPAGWDHLEHARRRLLFDDLLTLQLAIMANRHEWRSVPGPALQVTDDFLEPFVDAAFPYELTGAQRRAIADIRRDVTQPVPMNRLIQGDVGSGKTAVAAVAMAMALANGKQAALMAPTSILAEQHYRSLSQMFERAVSDRRPVIAMLTSALSNSERESIYRGIADGSIDVVIGTHALIQEGVQFHDLAVAVIDEQHRFGVEQRAALRGKGMNPHLLVMTATPIPRTLALTMYADLDLTIIDEKPPGRRPVKTRVIEPVTRERVVRFVEAQLEQGRQAFVVHPLVEASDRIDAASAVEAYEELSRVFFRHRVCLLHGRMKPAEKDEIMSAFSRHEYDVMVTTTVAEVGVDVPNASVIVIEGANRFGLAQLHQLRGRVGRGEHESYCLLIPDNDTPEALERLQKMEQIEDGFRLAEEDWKLRGPGDLLGTRQSGPTMLRLAEMMTPELVSLAQREARTIFEEDPTLAQPQHHLLAERIRMLQNDTSDVS